MKQIKAEYEIKFSKKINVMTTEKYPFNKSSARVATARDFFPVLKTLVAPIFPDPTERISPRPENFTRSNPKGMDPIRYPNIKER